MATSPRVMPNGYVFVGREYEHVRVVEKALGKPLRDGAEVHHVNGVRSDNRNCNLVVCESRTYHRLLHRRAIALRACGNANWRKCNFCKQHDAPENLYIIGAKGYHQACARAYATQKRVAARGFELHRRRYPWRDMSAGDSFLVECMFADRESVREVVTSAASGFCSRNPFLNLRHTTELVDRGVRVTLIQKSGAHV